MIKKIFITFIIFLTGQITFASGIPNINLSFFDRFNDTYLSCYIEEALKNNHDLQATAFKVEQYRQQVKISFGGELPSLSTQADYLGIHVPTYANPEFGRNAFIFPFIASYEPDFLLKNHDKTKSAKKAYAAVQEEQKSIYISLLSDVATNYINILQYDDLISEQKQIVNIENQKLLRDEEKFRHGIIDSSELSLSKQNVEIENNNLANFQKQEETVLNTFAMLIGMSPDNIDQIKRGSLDCFEYSGQIPSEVDSDVIFSRPDVLSIEDQLEKSKIDVRVARKELLPSFHINGIWAFNTLARGSFFSWQNSLAAIFAGATIDIFKGGQKVANLRLNKAVYEEIFEKYRQTDLNAVKEVNTALCIIKYDTDVDNNTCSKLLYETKIYTNGLKKYKRGIISYPRLIDMNKALITEEQHKSESKTTRLVNYITLYKAVGGAL